jgi:hypothetical protein
VALTVTKNIPGKCWKAALRKQVTFFSFPFAGCDCLAAFGVPLRILGFLIADLDTIFDAEYMGLDDEYTSTRHTD